MKEEKEKKEISRDFVDEKGSKSTLIIEEMNGQKINLKSNSKYKLQKNQNDMSNKKNKSILTREIGPKIKGDNVFTRDIGIRSHGFAQVASLSFIVALAGIFVMYLMLRY